MITNEDISRTLKAYLGDYPHDAEGLALLTDLLDAGVDVTRRTEFRGHVTASAVLLNERGLVLHILHNVTGRWMWPGGHLEAEDETLAGAALRELTEETGVDLALVRLYSDEPIHVDAHVAPARPNKGEPEHPHIDFRFLCRTSSAEVGKLQTEEVSGADWLSAAALPGPALRGRVCLRL